MAADDSVPTAGPSCLLEFTWQLQKRVPSFLPWAPVSLLLCLRAFWELQEVRWVNALRGNTQPRGQQSLVRRLQHVFYKIPQRSPMGLSPSCPQWLPLHEHPFWLSSCLSLPLLLPPGIKPQIKHLTHVLGSMCAVCKAHGRYSPCWLLCFLLC